MERPPSEAFENMGAFGGRTLAFEQWIQFVLLERIREIVRTRGAFPSSSQVGVYAVRELDGDPDAGELCSLPAVIFTLVEILPQFEGEGLEDQLRSYDTFLHVLSRRRCAPSSARCCARPRRRLTPAVSARGWAPASGRRSSAAAGT